MADGMRKGRKASSTGLRYCTGMPYGLLNSAPSVHTFLSSLL
jgi:hypothetical protein